MVVEDIARLKGRVLVDMNGEGLGELVLALQIVYGDSIHTSVAAPQSV